MLLYSVMDWEDVFLLFAMEPQLKDQKNVMVELDVLPCACDANWRSTTPCFLLVNVMLLPTMSVMDWEDVFLLFAMEPQLKDREECDGRELDVLPAPGCQLEINYSCFSCCEWMLLHSMSVMDWEDVFFCFAMEPQLKDQKECDGGAGWYFLPVMPTGDQLLLFLLACECDASANYVSDGLGGCILAVCDGASVEGSEECDGGAGCTSCLLMPTGDPSPCFLACECDASANYVVMDWEDVFLLFAMEPQLKDQKNVMVELDVLPCACDANWNQLLYLYLIVRSILTMDWEGCILAVCGTSVEGSEECDGGAGCTSCACDAN